MSFSASLITSRPFARARDRPAFLMTFDLIFHIAHKSITRTFLLLPKELPFLFHSYRQETGNKQVGGKRAGNGVETKCLFPS